MSLLTRAAKGVGISVEEDKRAMQDTARQQRHQEMINIYWWLREKLDESVAYFFATGSYDEVEKVCQEDALKKIKKQLADYQDKGLQWEMPGRRDKTSPQVAVLGEKGSAFTCEEKFLDFSVLRLIKDEKIVKESRNNGQPTASNATVGYDNAGHYWFSDFFILPLEG